MHIKKGKKIALIITFCCIIIFFASGCFFSVFSSPVTKQVDNYIYNLPFAKGSSYKVVQGYGGLFSHKNRAAIDFGMPVGTPIHAAREGIVYSYKENSNSGGPFAKHEKLANYLIIKHNDGSFGCYWHLKQNGVVAKKGFVQKGELIALSGATGLVVLPHLHFTVKKVLNYEMNSFIKTKFNTIDGIKLLKNGNRYSY